MRLVNLKSSQYNHHVGKVVDERHCESQGRFWVELHGVEWPDLDNSGTPAGRVRLSIKVENLRRCPRSLERPSRSTVLGTLASAHVESILGECRWGLPRDLVAAVIDFLSIGRIRHEDVAIKGASSTRGDFPVTTVLGDKPNEWWISKQGSFKHGRGVEWIEFEFGSPRRVSFIGIKIPPLPHGPLSVRRFHVTVPLAAGLGSSPGDEFSWVNPLPGVSFVTLDVEEIQEFALSPPVETSRIRLVATENAAAAAHGLSIPSAISLSSWCVGLFKVRFS